MDRRAPAPTGGAEEQDTFPDNMPGDYRPGYERARLLDPAAAANYVAHTTLGDPRADEVAELLSGMGPQERQALYRGCMDDDPEVMRRAPETVRRFFEELAEPVDWYDSETARPGIQAFHRNSDLILQAFAGGVLIEGFSTNISKSFVITGRLREQGVTRLKQNNRHVLDIFLPGGLERYGDGWKLSVRIRLVHAQVRRLLTGSPMWDADAWGMPLSSAHIALGAAAFSARLLKHATSLGARFTRSERDSFMTNWRYSTYLMGAPQDLLPKTEAEVLHFYDVATACEPSVDLESIISSNALIKAIPQLLGIAGGREHEAFLKKVYTVSRALIGDQLADALRFPDYHARAILPRMRLERRLNRAAGKILPGREGARRLNTFSHLMAVAAYDEAGISYAMPNRLGTPRRTP